MVSVREALKTLGKAKGLVAGLVLMVSLVGLCAACTMKFYSFSPAGTIDYTQIKTIQIVDFPNRASFVWGPMASMFNNELKDKIASHTKLMQVKQKADLKIEGEITSYTQKNKSTSSDGYSAQTELTITVRVNFKNNKKGKDGKENPESFKEAKQFTASTTYDTTQNLASVQEALVTEMVENLCDQIFNAIFAQW